MKYGYARVSTTEQDLTIQREALVRAGCEVIREEKQSGASTENRTELQTLLDFLRPNDILCVTRVDRLARSMRDLQNIVHLLKQKKVTLQATEQPIDTSTSGGKAFLDMLGVFAEFENNLRRERQLDGIKKAKAKGVYKGRVATIDNEHIKDLREQGLGASAIARKLNVGRTSVYRALAT